MSRSILFLAVLLPGLAQAGWRDDAAAARAACSADPAPCEVADTLRIRESRAGIWFTQDDRLAQPVMGPLLERFERETEPAVRVAIAHALVQMLQADDADATWFPAWSELAASDRDAQVRGVFLSALRRAPLEVAAPGLRGALSHADAETRLLAAAKMGGHAEAAVFVDDLLAALATEAVPDVQVRIVRALGSARDARAVPALQALGDRDEALTREVSRALQRIQEG